MSVTKMPRNADRGEEDVDYVSEFLISLLAQIVPQKYAKQATNSVKFTVMAMLSWALPASSSLRRCTGKLTPEQLEKWKEQNNTTSLGRLILDHIAILKSAKRWFLEYMEHQHPEVNVKAESSSS